MADVVVAVVAATHVVAHVDIKLAIPEVVLHVMIVQIIVLLHVVLYVKIKLLLSALHVGHHAKVVPLEMLACAIKMRVVKNNTKNMVGD